MAADLEFSGQQQRRKERISTSSEPDALEYGNRQPFGGNLVSHISTYIISLKRRKRDSIEATLIKSPLRGYAWHPLSITESGFYDLNFVDT
jgi:hypothetical protein